MELLVHNKQILIIIFYRLTNSRISTHKKHNQIQCIHKINKISEIVHSFLIVSSYQTGITFSIIKHNKSLQNQLMRLCSTRSFQTGITSHHFAKDQKTPSNQQITHNTTIFNQSITPLPS